MPRVVVDDGHARIRIRMIRMMLAAEPDDRRIDLDRIDMSTPWRSAAATSVPEPAPRISTSSKRVAEHAIRPLVEVFLLLDRRHRLVKDVVHLDDRVGPCLADGDLVVRRPDRTARHHVDEHQRSGEQHEIDAHERRDGRRCHRRCFGRPALRASAAAGPPPRRQSRTTWPAAVPATR